MRRVPVRLVALDVIDVPNLRCARCGAAMWVKEDGSMPKITVHGGPSDRFNNPPDSAEPEKPARAEVADVEPEPEPDGDVEAADEPADEPDEKTAEPPRKRGGRRAKADA